MAVTINLYPPITETYAPAFLIGSSNINNNKCKIYFTMSMFNDLSEVKNIQVAVRNASTNVSALNPDLYPSEIKLTTALQDADGNFYIEINPADIINEQFIIDQYYKVQLRFTSTDASNPPAYEVQAIDSWLNANQAYFSEWSKVTIARGISVPTISLRDYTEGATTEIYSTIANTQVVGKLLFADENETEVLKQYRVILYDDLDRELIDSGIIYTDINEFDYTFNYLMQEEHIYSFTLEYTTQNLFTGRATYYIEVLPSTETNPNIAITAAMEEENARASINISRAAAAGSYTGQVVIRRTDSKSNFTIYDDMQTWTLDNVSSINIDWYDYTIESGIWYKYAVQGITTSGNRMPMTEIANPIMVIFDHAYLTIADKQLKIKFNPSISSFRKTISDTKIDTIGSKYPIIKRNGYMDYAQFPISGLIATAMDEDGLFETKDSLYGENKTLYANYNTTAEIPDYRDLVYEKFFRDKVINFLYSDEAKLYRSPTEGNILIRLTDIQFQPNQTLGRRLWSFSGNAYEIDECSLNNYEKYGIIEKEKTLNTITSIYTPIKRIVIINNVDEFPAEGKTDVLYIYDKQLYIWNSTSNKYILISVPYWNETLADPEITPAQVSTLSRNLLYTNGTSLLQWNSNTDDLDLISEPEYNTDYLDGAE